LADGAELAELGISGGNRMTLNEALEQLSQMAGSGHDSEIRLQIDCPHCGRSGELDSIRPMVRVTSGHSRSDSTRERTQHDAELRRISMALNIPWPTSIEDIVTAIRALPR